VRKERGKRNACGATSGAFAASRSDDHGESMPDGGIHACNSQVKACRYARVAPNIDLILARNQINQSEREMKSIFPGRGRNDHDVVARAGGG
jgi:hypothetical protein